MVLINIHTHHPAGKNEILEVQNLLHHQLSVAETYPEKLFSFGIHPWNVDEIQIADAIQLLKHAGNLKNIIAIGECGIDKAKNSALEKQTEIFKIHVSVSEELKKPLIIHCVKAYDEILQIKKQIKARQQWIIHGFRKGQHMAEQLMQHGMYLSFGTFLTDELNKNKPEFASVPDHSFFLETDELDSNGINNIYEIAAKIRNTTVDLLAATIKDNFEKCFNIKVYDRN
jgi:TatD DNase family protein